MAKQNFKNLKKTLHEHGYSPSPEDLFEIQKNIRQLADVILKYEEKRHKTHNTDPPKK